MLVRQFCLTRSCGFTITMLFIKFQGELVSPFMAIRIPESKKFLLAEFKILGFEIWNTVQGIRNPTNNWNLESSTWNPEFMAWNPESKTVLESLTRGKTRNSPDTCIPHKSSAQTDYDAEVTCFSQFLTFCFRFFVCHAENS